DCVAGHACCTAFGHACQWGCERGRRRLKSLLQRLPPRGYGHVTEMRESHPLLLRRVSSRRSHVDSDSSACPIRSFATWAGFACRRDRRHLSRNDFLLRVSRSSVRAVRRELAVFIRSVCLSSASTSAGPLSCFRRAAISSWTLPYRARESSDM